MKCTACDMENIEGAIFCEECGVKLEAEAGLPEAAGETGGGEKKLVFKAQDGAMLELPVKEEVVIGREDPISEIFPDLDLTGYGGAEGGVSRKHAVIHLSGPEYTIEDLGSTNGTYVNKKKIQPHAPQEIKSGDEVRFGKLSFLLQAA